MATRDGFGRKPSQGDSKDVVVAARDRVSRILESKKVQDGMLAVATEFLTAKTMLPLVVNAVSRTPDLALCETSSLLGCIMTAQSLGLEPNTVRQQAFLIPRQRRSKDANGNWQTTLECQFMVGWRGFVTLMRRIPEILVVDGEAIRERDTFNHMKGSRAFLEFSKHMDGDRGALIGAYCFTRHIRDVGEAEQATILTSEDIRQLRDQSDSYKFLSAQRDEVEEALAKGEKIPQWKIDKAREKFAETPWVKWQDQMWRKSAVRAHSSMVQIGDAGRTLAVAAEVDAKDDARVIDMSAMANPEVARAVAKEGAELPPVGEQASQEGFFPRVDSPDESPVEPDDVDPETGEAPPPPQQEQQRPPASASAQMEYPFKDPKTGEWTDSTRDTYDPERHNNELDDRGIPKVTKDGVFVKRRGTRPRPGATQKPPPPSAPSHPNAPGGGEEPPPLGAPTRQEEASESRAPGGLPPVGDDYGDFE